MNKQKQLIAPFKEGKLKELSAGDLVSLSGSILSARDAAHKRLIETIESGTALPIDINNQALFYLGPSPTPPGKNCGSIGPTTAARMDEMTEPLLKAGLKATIGKGKRSETVKKLFGHYGAVYFVAVGGVAAYLSKKVKKIEVIAYPDLGPEAIYRLEVKDFPLIVAYDTFGGDIFQRL
jgi:fumarate hydratase subunit beta